MLGELEAGIDLPLDRDFRLCMEFRKDCRDLYAYLKIPGGYDVCGDKLGISTVFNQFDGLHPQ